MVGYGSFCSIRAHSRTVESSEPLHTCEYPDGGAREYSEYSPHPDGGTREYSKYSPHPRSTPAATLKPHLRFRPPHCDRHEAETDKTHI